MEINERTLRKTPGQTLGGESDLCSYDTAAKITLIFYCDYDGVCIRLYWRGEEVVRNKQCSLENKHRNSQTVLRPYQSLIFSDQFQRY